MAAGRHGRELGLTALSARGSELEQDFAYGLVRQLFEAPLVAASPPERAELLAGAAGHAAALFGLAPAREDVADALLDPSFAILHGLYWLCANLGRRCPLLLCIDDVHWLAARAHARQEARRSTPEPTAPASAGSHTARTGTARRSG